MRAFGRHLLLTLKAIALSLLLPVAGYAESDSLLIVTNSKHPLHHVFLTQLKKRLEDLHHDIDFEVVDSSHWQPKLSKGKSLTLALGNKAAIKLGQHRPDQPVLFGLLPKSTFDRVVLSNAGCAAGKCSAIYIDQPLQRELQLARLALPELKTIGVLTSPQSNVDINSLTRIANKLGVNIEHQLISNTDKLVFVLGNILKTSDVLLSLPDASIYSSRTVQNILLTAYRYHRPVIGYSHAFVKAGALFAVYSTPAQLSKQSAEVIHDFFKNKSLPSAQPPRYFSVSVNTRVARSLGIRIDSESTLQQKLEAMKNE